MTAYKSFFLTGSKKWPFFIPGFVNRGIFSVNQSADSWQDSCSIWNVFFPYHIVVFQNILRKIFLGLYYKAQRLDQLQVILVKHADSGLSQGTKIDILRSGFLSFFFFFFPLCVRFSFFEQRSAKNKNL